MNGDAEEPGRTPTDPSSPDDRADHAVVASRPVPNPFVLFGLGGANAVCWLVGFFVGWLVDRELGTAPAFVVVGLLVGAASGVLLTYQEVRRYLRQ